MREAWEREKKKRRKTFDPNYLGLKRDYLGMIPAINIHNIMGSYGDLLGHIGRIFLFGQGLGLIVSSFFRSC